MIAGMIVRICGMINLIKPGSPAKLTTHPARMTARVKSKKAGKRDVQSKRMCDIIPKSERV